MKKTVSDLLLENRDYYCESKKITFINVDNRDVYNISAPFVFEGLKYIVARVEPRENINAKSCFFKQINELKYELCNNLPMFDLEDPFITKIKNEYVFGGVKVYNDNTKLIWTTVFYRGKNIRNLTKFAESPIGMKDVRLVELNNKIGVFTRPQNGIYKKGKIGFTVINDLDELTERKINSAKILELFNDDEWGGVNEARKYNDDKIFVIGHIAKYSNENIKHYYPISFVFNYKSFIIENLKIIAKSDDFKDIEAKRENLRDIVFPGGLSDYFTEKVKLFVGIGDAEGQMIEIYNPFILNGLLRKE
jgi:hypothetical protein